MDKERSKGTRTKRSLVDILMQRQDAFNLKHFFALKRRMQRADAQESKMGSPSKSIIFDSPKREFKPNPVVTQEVVFEQMKDVFVLDFLF